MNERERLFKSQGNVFHFHIHGGNVVDESTAFQGDQVQNKTEIANSNIEKILSGHPGSGENGYDELPVSVQKMNLGQTESDRVAPRPRKQQEKHRHQGENTTKPDRQERITETDNLIRISFLKGKASAHLQNGEYQEAKKILDELKSSQDFQELDVLLLMAECDVQLGRRSADKCIERLRDMILGCSALTAHDIKSWGDQLQKSGRNVGSILLYWISSNKYKTEETDPNKLIAYIEGKASDIEDSVDYMSQSSGRSRAIVVDYVIELLTEILDNISSTIGADPDVKALMEGDCLSSIVCVCNHVEEYQKSIHFGLNGLDVFEQQFGRYASRYQTYSFLLHNLGNAYHNSSRYAEAEPYYVKSIEAKVKTTDFTDENERQKLIEATKISLANTRKNLAKRK